MLQSSHRTPVAAELPCAEHNTEVAAILYFSCDDCVSKHVLLLLFSFTRAVFALPLEKSLHHLHYVSYNSQYYKLC